MSADLHAMASDQVENNALFPYPVGNDTNTSCPSTKEAMTCFCSGSSCGYPRFPAATTAVASIASLDHQLMPLLSLVPRPSALRPGYEASRYSSPLSALLSLRFHAGRGYVILEQSNLIGPHCPVLAAQL